MWVPKTLTVVVTGVAAVAGGLCIYKDLRSGTPFDIHVKAENKVVIITGANSGIGKEAAWEMAFRGAKVFMACRNMKKCEQARREIVEETRNRYVYCRQCDLASLDSIREFVKIFKKEEPVLDILINNAGVMRCPKSVTKDGFETQFGVNHLGHFLLTNLLLDLLLESDQGRIVIVTSSSHYDGKINKKDPNLSEDYDPGVAYNQSKLANILFANELSRKLLETRVTVNSVHPGWVDTNIDRHLPWTQGLRGYLTYPFFWPFMKKPRLGAHAVIQVALDSKLTKVTGEYFVDMKPAEPSKDAQDIELGMWLWKLSEKWTRLDESEKISLRRTK